MNSTQLVFPSNTLAQAFTTTWHTDAIRPLPALTDGTRVLTYEAVDTLSMQLAAGFAKRGVAAGSAIAITMQRSLDALLVILAALRAGGCPCVIEQRLSTAEVMERLAAVEARWLVCDAEHEGLAAQLEDAVTVIPFDTLPADPQAAQVAPVRPDTRALLLFTSGSTGRRKAVQLTQSALLNNALGVIDHSGLSSRDRLLHTMPIYHTNGVNNQLFAPLLAGSTVIFAERFRAGDMPGLMARHRPTIITGVPTMYARMRDQQFDPASFAALRMARCGSAPITRELHVQVEALLGCELVVSYGLSEATCTSTMNPPGKRRIGSVGTPLRGQRVQLREEGGQMTNEALREGEICIAGASVMTGYVGAIDETSRAVSDGWLRTGDLGRFDEDGYLYVTGRIKGVIIRGGENLSPMLIESTVLNDSRVAACCVVGRADADLGEVPAAFVVLTPGSQMTEDEVRDAVRQRLSPIYVPHYVFFISSLPETFVGKVDKKALVASFATG